MHVLTRAIESIDASLKQQSASMAQQHHVALQPVEVARQAAKASQQKHIAAITDGGQYGYNWSFSTLKLSATWMKFGELSEA